MQIGSIRDIPQRHGKLKCSPKEGFPLKRECMWWRGIVKFLSQEVFPLMREAMFLSGKLNFLTGSFSLCRKLFSMSEIEIFITGSCSFDAGSLMVKSQIEIFSTASIHLDAGSHVVTSELENFFHRKCFI